MVESQLRLVSPFKAFRQRTEGASMGSGGKPFLAEKGGVEDCISRSFVTEELGRQMAGMRWGKE